MRREELNARHRMLEMGIGVTALAAVMRVNHTNVSSRLGYMSRETCALFEALLVLPERALHQPDARVCSTHRVPDMRGWHSCMRAVLKRGEPYPGEAALFESCEAHARLIQTGVDGGEVRDQ